jgi:hypothetical protein
VTRASGHRAGQQRRWAMSGSVVTTHLEAARATIVFEVLAQAMTGQREKKMGDFQIHLYSSVGRTRQHCPLIFVNKARILIGDIASPMNIRV